MAVADLLVILTSVVLNRIITVYFPGSFLSITPVCALKSSLVYAAKDSSVWLTVTFTIDRYVAICCQKLKTKCCTKEVAAGVVVAVFVLSCLRNIPWYFAMEPLYFNNNVPWSCNIKSNFYTETPWIAFSYLTHALTPIVPLILIVLLNTLTVRSIVVANQVRRALCVKKYGKDDPEVENRRKSIILLLTVSGSFILLWMTFTVHYIYFRILSPHSYTGYNDPLFILQEAGYLLLLLSCCTNTCIYAVIQNKFREEIKEALKYPFRILLKMFKGEPLA
ncbi:probable G-protein coupled receptor 139 [Scyliorhinus canicula]|uniref:probable G-protein coupled receptor 139 n=1 Tax=Scyliorhinus canicula TaxID=7830 RepID=UPI0018F62F3E|nr:probable G-protein coupled receptor 139 [Scyliorhinus canicula]